ncbi:hypothetical protein T07_7489 [Trichinella nelsoni]|uniref:Uncharacterized protein n=1 Tax=Trichinella nelsoni TaxID=6336 RepID=A0A0V0S7L6_9BILA|nr:hypothetical protein T07_7489 [Trichinella nelsoni]
MSTEIIGLAGEMRGRNFMQLSLMQKASFNDNQPNSSQISTVNDTTRHRYHPNEAVMYAYSFSQKNAPVTYNNMSK